jgi:hypothetical protein
MAKCDEGQHDFYPPVVTVLEVEVGGFLRRHRRQWAYCFLGCRSCGTVKATWTKWLDDGENNYSEV